MHLLTHQNFAIDSAVVYYKNGTVCIEASLLMQCIITEKQSNQINTL